MFLAHSFRLRDPWTCEPTADCGTRWSRVFHKPTGLEPDDALWLVCSGLPAGAVVSLNGTRLTPGDARASPAPNQFDITALLAAANRIDLVVPSDPAPPAAHRPPPTPFPYDVRLGVVGHS
jgi:hypothetical protein